MFVAKRNFNYLFPVFRLHLPSLVFHLSQQNRCTIMNICIRLYHTWLTVVALNFYITTLILKVIQIFEFTCECLHRQAPNLNLTFKTTSETFKLVLVGECIRISIYSVRFATVKFHSLQIYQGILVQLSLLVLLITVWTICVVSKSFLDTFLTKWTTTAITFDWIPEYIVTNFANTVYSRWLWNHIPLFQHYGVCCHKISHKLSFCIQCLMIMLILVAWFWS